jgi:phosphoribosylamine--glycine ligase
MKVGIIGSGGREHAICQSIKKSSKVEKIYCFPGNAGTSELAENIEIDFSDFTKIKEFSITNKISLLIVGPEKPLVDGIVDFFKDTEIDIFGPDKISSQLEGSKIFTKKVCEKYEIPTAKFGISKNVLIEEFITVEEMSYFIISDCK